MHLNAAETEKVPHPIRDVPEFDKQTLLELEYEYLGCFISGSPLDRWSEQIARISGLSDVSEANEDSSKGKTFSLCGLCRDYREKSTHKGTIISFRIEGEDGGIKCFSYNASGYEAVFRQGISPGGTPFIVNGVVDYDEKWGRDIKINWATQVTYLDGSFDSKHDPYEKYIEVISEMAKNGTLKRFLPEKWNSDPSGIMRFVALNRKFGPSSARSFVRRFLPSAPWENVQMKLKNGWHTLSSYDYEKERMKKRTGDLNKLGEALFRSLKPLKKRGQKFRSLIDTLGGIDASLIAAAKKLWIEKNTSAPVGRIVSSLPDDLINCCPIGNHRSALLCKSSFYNLCIKEMNK